MIEAVSCEKISYCKYSHLSISWTQISQNALLICQRIKFWHFLPIFITIPFIYYVISQSKFSGLNLLCVIRSLGWTLTLRYQELSISSESSTSVNLCILLRFCVQQRIWPDWADMAARSLMHYTLITPKMQTTKFKTANFLKKCLIQAVSYWKFKD